MAGTKPLFVLEGNGPCLNRGCEAILLGTHAILQHAFGPARFVSAPPIAAAERDRTFIRLPGLIHRPDFVRQRFSIDWWRRQVNRRLRGFGEFSFEPFLSRCSAVLALGGDNLSLDYNVPRRQFAAGTMALDSGKPFIIWGASIGPFTKDPDFEREAIAWLKTATIICAREPVTIRYLAEHGVTENVRKVADPAFVMEPEKPSKLSAELTSALSGGALGLNFSTLAGRFTEDRDRWPNLVEDCVEQVLQHFDHPVVLIPHVVVPAYSDFDFLAEIHKRLARYGDRLVLVGPHYSAPEVKWIIGRLTAFAGARMHATIAALSQHVPTLSLGYSAKSRGLNEDLFGHCDWMQTVDSLTPEALVAKLRKLLAEHGHVSSALRDMMPTYRQQAWQSADYVAEAIDRTPGMAAPRRCSQ